MSRKKVWHPEDIKAEVRKTGITLTKLAKDNGLGGSACREALIYPRPVADRLISEVLGVPLSELWPERYDESGSRRPTNVGKRARKLVRKQRLSAGAF